MWATEGVSKYVKCIYMYTFFKTKGVKEHMPFAAFLLDRPKDFLLSTNLIILYTASLLLSLLLSISLFSNQ